MEELVNETRNRLNAQFPCRTNVIDSFIRLFGKPGWAPIPSYFVYGHKGTGKASLINCFLKELNHRFVYVNCKECYTPKLLFEILLNNLTGIQPTAKNEFVGYRNCDTVNDFVNILKNAIIELKYQSDSVYLILDDAHHLLELNINIFQTFLRLQELLERPVAVIFISELSFETFGMSSTVVFEPIKIHVPDYTLDEVVEILSKSFDGEFSEEFCINFLKAVLHIYYPVCHNIEELKYLIKQNFKKYVEPIVHGELTESSTAKLWKSFEPHLKESMRNIYMRGATFDHNKEQNNPSTFLGSKVKVQSTNIDLPYFSKYLLIAAYIASYNPSSSDNRYFLKNHGKIRKSTRRKMKVNQHMLGPKTFPLNRLLAIFYTIIEVRVSTDADIFSQISTLVTLNLLSQISGKDLLQSPKYKCLVSLELITSVAKTVNFDIVGYLFDFVQ